ncbi:MAG: TolC family protein [Isosphaeraceae bacterium]
MRFPHNDASAVSGRGGPYRSRFILPALLALVSGCAVQQTPRVIEGQVTPGPSGIRTTYVPPVLNSQTGGPRSQPVPQPTTMASTDGRDAAPPSLPVLPVDLSGEAPTAFALSGSAPVSRTSDKAVKRVADEEMKAVVPAPPVIPPPSGENPLDLATALRLADVVNPTIGRARTVILEALASQLAARTLLLPSLNGGGNYHGHNGDLQRPTGRIELLSEQSLYLGAGAGAVGSGTVAIPGVNILTPLTDAWFEPLAARQRVDATRFIARATENDILMDVSVQYLELIRHSTMLEADRLSEFQAFQIVQAIREYAITGQGRKADFDRAKAEWRYRRADVQKAEEGVGVATARLARRLNLDPSIRLRPAGGPLVPLDLVALDTSPEQLIQVALRLRPELGARGAEIGEAEARVKQEIGRPLLPTLWLGFSGGGFGGGSNLNPPLVGRFAGRTDFDVRLYWTLLNFGAGNAALIHQRQAQVGQAVAERARTINRVRSEVIAAQADARSARNQIEIARRELASSHAGFHEDLPRIRNNLGRAIEVINSLNLLAGSRVNVIDALVRYDQAQFRLWVALGSPPPLVEASSPDQPPVPDYLVP